MHNGTKWSPYLSTLITTLHNEVSTYYLIKRQSCHHIETSHMIYTANQLTGSYMMTTLTFNELKLPICITDKNISKNKDILDIHLT